MWTDVFQVTILTHLTSENNANALKRDIRPFQNVSSSSVSCLQASCLSSSGLWSDKGGSFPSFQIQSKEGGSTFGSEYVSHGEV